MGAERSGEAQHCTALVSYSTSIRSEKQVHATAWHIISHPIISYRILSYHMLSYHIVATTHAWEAICTDIQTVHYRTTCTYVKLSRCSAVSQVRTGSSRGWNWQGRGRLISLVWGPWTRDGRGRGGGWVVTTAPYSPCPRGYCSV